MDDDELAAIEASFGEDAPDAPPAPPVVLRVKVTGPSLIAVGEALSKVLDGLEAAADADLAEWGLIANGTLVQVSAHAQPEPAVPAGD